VGSHSVEKVGGTSMTATATLLLAALADFGADSGGDTGINIVAMPRARGSG